MEKIKKKLDYLDETLKLLGLSEAEVVNLWQQIGRLNGVSTLGVERAILNDDCIPLTKSNLSKIQIGMIWYEDDTVSFERIPCKKVKTIIEHIDGNKIYGDLTASELHDIPEQELSWYDAKQYFENFSYPCKENENIVWYDIDQLEKVCETYDAVRKTFKKIGKMFRDGWFWSSTEYDSNYARYVVFHSGRRSYDTKYATNYVRPVLEFELQ